MADSRTNKLRKLFREAPDDIFQAAKRALPSTHANSKIYLSFAREAKRIAEGITASALTQMGDPERELIKNIRGATCSKIDEEIARAEKDVAGSAIRTLMLEAVKKEIEKLRRRFSRLSDDKEGGESDGPEVNEASGDSETNDSEPEPPQTVADALSVPEDRIPEMLAEGAALLARRYAGDFFAAVEGELEQGPFAPEDVAALKGLFAQFQEHARQAALSALEEHPEDDYFWMAYSERLSGFAIDRPRLAQLFRNEVLDKVLEDLEAVESAGDYLALAPNLFLSLNANGYEDWIDTIVREQAGQEARGRIARIEDRTAVSDFKRKSADAESRFAPLSLEAKMHFQEMVSCFTEAMPRLIQALAQQTDSPVGQRLAILLGSEEKRVRPHFLATVLLDKIGSRLLSSSFFLSGRYGAAFVQLQERREAEKSFLEKAAQALMTSLLSINGRDFYELSRFDVAAGRRLASVNALDWNAIPVYANERGPNTVYDFFLEEIERFLGAIELLAQGKPLPAPRPSTPEAQPLGPDPDEEVLAEAAAPGEDELEPAEEAEEANETVAGVHTEGKTPEEASAPEAEAAIGDWTSDRPRGGLQSAPRPLIPEAQALEPDPDEEVIAEAAAPGLSSEEAAAATPNQPSHEVVVETAEPVSSLAQIPEHLMPFGLLGGPGASGFALGRGGRERGGGAFAAALPTAAPLPTPAAAPFDPQGPIELLTAQIEGLEARARVARRLRFLLERMAIWERELAQHHAMSHPSQETMDDLQRRHEEVLKTGQDLCDEADDLLTSISANQSAVHRIVSAGACSNKDSETLEAFLLAFRRLEGVWRELEKLGQKMDVLEEEISALAAQIRTGNAYPGRLRAKLGIHDLTALFAPEQQAWLEPNDKLVSDLGEFLTDIAKQRESVSDLGERVDELPRDIQSLAQAHMKAAMEAVAPGPKAERPESLAQSPGQSVAEVGKGLEEVLEIEWNGETLRCSRAGLYAVAVLTALTKIDENYKLMGRTAKALALMMVESLHVFSEYPDEAKEDKITALLEKDLISMGTFVQAKGKVSKPARASVTRPVVHFTSGFKTRAGSSFSVFVASDSAEHFLGLAGPAILLSQNDLINLQRVVSKRHEINRQKKRVEDRN